MDVRLLFYIIYILLVYPVSGFFPRKKLFMKEKLYRKKQLKHKKKQLHKLLSLIPFFKYLFHQMRTILER